MVSFEEAAAMLDEAAEALPKEIFDKLNGGVNLIPARKTDTDGLLIMGMYFVDQMGRHVEIYYGSFCEAFPNVAPEKARAELTKTLKHELTHHIENLAWDRSLEKWDDTHRAELLSQLYGGRLEADSVLFVCMDNAGLSPIAEGLFRLAAAGVCPRIVCASAGLSDKLPEQVNDRAVRAAAAYGADISAHTPRTVTRDMLARFDAVLCMTEEQGDELAQLFPAFDAKIMCLGEKDLVPPLLGGQGGWLRAADRIASEIEYLIAELCGEAEKDEPDRP
jgi:protein-tyrosine-phosphatase